MSTVTTPTRPLLDFKALAARLGVTAPTLRRLIRDGGGPPYVRIGVQYRFREEDVEEWLLAHRQAR